MAVRIVEAGGPPRRDAGGQLFAHHRLTRRQAVHGSQDLRRLREQEESGGVQGKSNLGVAAAHHLCCNTTLLPCADGSPPVRWCWLDGNLECSSPAH